MKKLTFLFLMLVAFVTTSMAQVDTNKMYRLKDNATSKYLTAFNHDEHATGPYGGVGATALAADNEDQIFIFEQSGSNYKMKTKSGYYIYAQEWNVDALPSKSSEFKFTANGTSGYRMQVYNTNKGNSWYYVKNENVSGTHYLFGDAAFGAAATWIFEEVVIAVESRTITVSANNDAWGTVSGGGTAEGPITITATPADGCKFVEWQLNGEQVSTQQNYIDETAGDKEYVAIFAELSPYDLICKPTFAKAGNTSFVSAATILANGETSTIDVSSLAVVGQQGFVEAGETYAGATFDLNLTYTVNWGNVTIFQIEEDQTSVIYGPYNGVWPNGNPISAMAAAGIPVNGNTATFAITIPSDAQVGDMIIIRSLVGGNTDACQTGITEGGYIDFIFTVANPPYTVTVTSSNEVMGTVSPASAKVRGGETITISATPNEGYEFVNWTIDGGDGPNTNPWEVTVTEDLDFVANFQIIPGTQTFNISVSSADETMGSVEASTLEVVDGNTVTLTATANDGYRFVNWTVEGEEVSTSATYEATITAETAFVANFEALPVYPVSVSVNDDTMGTAEISASEVIEGKTVTLTATAKAGYLFANWTVGGEEVSIENPYTATITAETAFVANFVEKQYCVVDGAMANTGNGAGRMLNSFTLSDGASQLEVANIQTSGTDAVYKNKTDLVLTTNPGATLSFSAMNWTGSWMHAYVFVDYNKDKEFNQELNNNGTTTGEIVSYNAYNVSTTETEDWRNIKGESVAAGCGVSASNIPSWTLPANLKAGDYRLRFKVDWNSINACGDAEINNNNGCVVDVTLRIELPIEPTVYAVSVATADEAMGTAEVSATEVEEGEEVTFTATANEGYQFVNWTSGEAVVSTENPYTVAVTAEMALTANFELIPVTKYTVTVNAGVGGTAEASATEVEEGQTVTLTATAAEGYAFANWTSSAESVYYIQNYNTGKYLGYNTANLAAIDNQTSDVTFTPSTMNAGEFTIFLTNATYNQESPAKQISYMHCGSSGRFSGNPVNTDAAQQIAIYKVEDPAAETITATKVTEITSGATYIFVGLKDGAYYALTDELHEANDATKQRMVGAAVTITDGTLTYTGDANVLWTIVNKSIVSTENPYTVTVTSNIDMTANFVEVPVVKYAVSAVANPVEAGSVTISATEVEENGTVDLTATANEGYEFVNWTVEGTEVSTDASFTATVTAETAYVANFVAQEFTITYIVDGEVYETETYAYGESVTPQAAPAEKEGYTFSGWSAIPATMPAEDVEVTGTFTVNSYNIVYYVDGEVYETETYAYGATVTPVAVPAEKEGYTFSGWSEIPATMPANDVEVTGTFAVNSYEIVYYVDGEEYVTETYAYGESVTPQAAPADKDGYTFSGWSEIPATMPANDVEVTGTFTVNSYDIVYYVDGEEYETETYAYGATVTPVAEPTKDGYTFSGWSAIPATMPAEDVEVTGTFTIVIKEDVVVTDENKEENANATYANVTVANEKVWDIKANTISADKVSVSVSATGVAPQIKIEDGGKVTAALEVNRVVKKGEWAMMALPFAVDLANVTVDGVAAQNNVNIKVMVYDAAKRANESIELWTKSGWVDLQGTTIAANQGFAVAVNAQNGDEQTVTFASAPQTYDGADKEVALDRHASTVNEGADADWNFFGNPTLANAEKGTGYALYIYNAEDDSYDEYASSDAVTCQPYAAMFAQSADDFNSLNFSAGTAGALADANGVYGEMQFSLNGEDEARVVLSDEANAEYVRNEDALYFAAPNANLAQLYIVKGNIKMAVSEQPEISESIALGYKAAKAGVQTLTLTSMPDNTNIILKDNVTGDEVALTVGDSYTFESAAGTFNNRFVVTTTDLTGIAQATTGDVKVVVNGDDINVYGAEAGTEVVAYTTNGVAVASAVAEEGVTTISTSANGVIIVKVADVAVKVIK